MRWHSPTTNITQWHPYYAWVPVRVGECVVWLDYVERKAKGWDPTIGLYGVEYRLRP